MVFYVLMVLELYRLVLEKYKGLYSLGRWALYLSLAISVSDLSNYLTASD